MAVLQARIYASVYGTATELAASTKVLGIGERWYRTDAPIVTDNTSPFFGLKDPARTWKTGDGTKTWVQIVNYDPAGGGSGGSGPGTPDLNPLTVLANIGEEGAPGSSLLIVGDETTPEDTPTLANIMGALTQGHYSALSSMIGTLTEAEIDGGGLRSIINNFMAIRQTAAVNVTGTIASGSDTVTLSTPLDSKVYPWARVFVLSGGTGVANPAYINSIASNRLSFKLTTTMFNFVDGAGTPLNATASGSRNFEIRDASAGAFGLSLAGIPQQNVYNGIYTYRSTPNALQSNTITGETVEKRIFNGIEFIRSAQVNGGAWEQQSGGVDLVLYAKTLVAAVGPGTHHTWTNLPATATAPNGTEFLGETQGRHQFKLLIPDDNYTQFMMGIDRLIVAGTNTSTMWVEFIDPADLTWKDLTTTRSTVSLNTPIDTAKTSAWQTIVAAAKTAAAAALDRSIICRVMAVTTGAATGSPQFTNVWTLVR